MKLGEIIQALGTRGGVLEQYRKEYTKSVCGMGDWHKHCPMGYVLFLGVDIVSEDREKTVSYIVPEEYYKAENCWLVPLDKCKIFDKNLMLNDRW